MAWSDPCPSSWLISRLDQLVSDDAPIIYGILQPGPEQQHGVPYVRPTEIVDGHIRLTDVRMTTPDIAAKYKRSTLRSQDVLLSIVGTIGKVAVVPDALNGANITQSSVRIRPGAGMLTEWLSYGLSSPTMKKQFSELTLGTGVPRLNVAHVREASFPLAPLNEQRRIVEKLDAIFEKSRAAKARLERLPALLDQLKRSILAAAFRGDLTKDWRAANPDVDVALLERQLTADKQKAGADSRKKRSAGSSTNAPAPLVVPASWFMTRLAEVAEIQLGQRRAPEYVGEAEYDYVRAANITWRGLDLTDVKRMGFANPAPLVLRPGDVVLNEASGSATEVGKPALWRGERENCCIQATVLRLRAWSPAVLGEWLYFRCLHDALLGKFIEMAPGVGILHLTADRMRDVPVAVPPISEQVLMCERLRAAMSMLYRLEDDAREHLARFEGIEQAALAKAFRGELVPQDPSDEPANVLLERLRSSTSAMPAAKRTRSPRTVDAPSTTQAPTVGDPVDGIVSILREQRRQSASAIIAATGLDAAKVKTVLKSLERLGKVSVEGKARGTTYVWQG